METKRCQHCKQFKPVESFSKNKTKPDGLDSYCISCKSLANKRYRTSDKGKAKKKVLNARWRKTDKCKSAMKVYSKRYLHSPLGKTTTKRRRLKYLADPVNQQKRIAQSRVTTAIRYGRLPRPSTLRCSTCDNQAADYHHHLGYSKEHWLDVIALCRFCHYRENNRQLT